MDRKYRLVSRTVSLALTAPGGMRSRLSQSPGIPDPVVDAWVPPPRLAYRFDNPGFAVVAQLPHPDSPRTIATSGEEWQYDTGHRILRWGSIHVPLPLKEAMKGFIHHLLETRSVATAEQTWSALKRIQPLLKDPADYPFTEEKALSILGNLQHDRDGCLAFKSLYAWSIGEVPGFTTATWEVIEPIYATKRPTYAGVKHREHVLTHEEDYALRKRFGQSAPPSPAPDYPQLPDDIDPDGEYSLDDLARWHDHVDYYTRLPWSFRRLVEGRYGLAPIVPGRQGQPVFILRYRGCDLLAKIPPYLERQRFMWLRNNLLVHLTYMWAPRPIQTVGINESGLIKTVAEDDPEGEPIYQLRIPRAKQSTGEPTHKTRAITPALGRQFEDYIALKHRIYGPADGDAPMFIREGASGVERMIKDNASMIILNTCRSVGVNRNPRDLRHNLGQKLADMGLGAATIQEVLDHTDETSLRHYLRAALGLSEIQDEALQDHSRYHEVMGKLAGTIPVMRKEEAPKGANVVSGTVARVFIGGIGVCGLQALPCDLSPVYSCAGCPKFHPFAEVHKFKKLQQALRAEIEGYLHHAIDHGLTHRQALSHADVLLEIEVVIRAILAKLEGKETPDDE